MAMAVLFRSTCWLTFIGLAFAVLVGQPAISQTPVKRLAVLEFKGESIKGEVLDTFADAVRGGAVEALAGRRVQVMTRENMMVLLKDMGKKDCSEGDCEVETARNIGADFVVSGSVVRIDAAFVVTLKLHETKGGSLLASDQIEARSQIELLRQLREKGRNLVANNLGARPAAPSPVPEPAPGTRAPSRTAPASVHGCAANQILIPGGTFWMGDPDYAKPVHKVTLSPFCIDRTEVTVAGYRACVQDGGCPPPSATVDWKDIKPEEKTKWSPYCTWGKRKLDEHPINCVDWNQATTFCEWAGGRLPSEAEWEYAARGKDGRLYPWGNQRPDASRLNACGGECGQARMYPGDDGWPATAPVGSFPEGASAFGVLDMAGNVWEWTADSFADYSDQPVTDPQRLQHDGSPRVFRGGSWTNVDPAWVRAGYRNKRDPGSRTLILGFRCARPAKN
jgi:formylglycine-generating enzyme required for sulfatase activity